MTRLLRRICLLLLPFLVGCAGAGVPLLDGSGRPLPAPFDDPVPVQVSGRATYAFLPARSDGRRSFLAFAEEGERPVRMARVALLDEQSTVLSESVTDESGAYVLGNPGLVARVKVRLFAQTGGQGPRIRVQDNTNGGLLYAADSPVEDLRQDPVVNLRLSTGYDPVGNVSDPIRPSGAFAVLDSILTVSLLFQEAGEDFSLLPETVVNWSVNNSTARGDNSTGAIGTSHFNGQENALFILGKANNDTDEFDWHVMVHEYGHWYQFNAGRNDAPGGPHSFGEVKDGRLAFSEGYGNALGAIVLQDPLYRDTKGQLSSDGFTDDLEFNNQADPSTRGWYSEATVGYLVVDLFDPIDPREPSGLDDRFDLPFSLLREGLLAQRDSAALTTIFSFLAGLVGQLDAQDLAALLAFHTLDQDFGINATDAFALAETHDAGNPETLPLFRPADALIGAGPQPLSLAATDGNELTASRFLLLTGTGRSLELELTSESLSAALYENGRQMDRSRLIERPTSVVFPTLPGAVYILVLTLPNEGQINTQFSLSEVTP